jgi:hypothetical protein
MSLVAFVANLSMLVRDALNEHQSTTQSAVSEQAPFAADDPEFIIIRCMRNDAYYDIVVSKHGGKIAGIQTVQLLLPPQVSTDGLTSAFEIALTDAINKTHSERIVGRDLHVQMDNIGACVASTHIANIIIAP